jgi:signal transduction histidine kinase
MAADETCERKVSVHRLLDTAPTAGDPVLIERLAQNLVENAIRHNHADGELWVTTRQRDHGAELVVSNTGLPVPVYELDTIF